MLSDRDKSLTVSITDLSRNVQHFILMTQAICIKQKTTENIHFCNILDDVIVQLKLRFENFSKLSFQSLINCLKFSKMAQEFDDTKLQSLSQKYAKFFDCVKLKADLIGLYSSPTVRNEKTPAQLLSFCTRMI